MNWSYPFSDKLVLWRFWRNQSQSSVLKQNNYIYVSSILNWCQNDTICVNFTIKLKLTQIYFTTMTELSIHNYTNTCDTYINNSGRRKSNKGKHCIYLLRFNIWQLNNWSPMDMFFWRSWGWCRTQLNQILFIPMTKIH